jgi:large repetitive protein
VFEGAFEDNNVRATLVATEILGAPTPDLAVVSVTAPASATTTQQVTVSWVVANAGEANAAGTWQDRVYLSADGTLDGAVLLATVSQGRQLQPGQQYAASTTVTLPEWSDGSYRVVVVTDATRQVFERDREANNLGVSEPLLLGHPNLRMVSVVAPAEAESADTVQVSWRVENAGSRDVGGAWVDRVYLVQGGVIGPGARLLGELARSGPLAPGAGYDAVLNVQVPIDVSGDWQIVVRTDAMDVVRETGAENDNERYTLIRISLAPYADLVVSNVLAPNETVADPAYVTISWTVTNEGTGRGLTGSWIDQVVVSRNETLGDGDDIVLASFTRNGFLEVGDSYTRTEQLVLPPGFTGRYHLFVRTDATNVLFENGLEANNAGRRRASSMSCGFRMPTCR